MENVKQKREQAAIRRDAVMLVLKDAKTGLTRKEISQAISADRMETIEAVRKLRDSGLAVRASTSLSDPNARWATPENAEEAKRYVFEAQAERMKVAAANEKEAKARNRKKRLASAVTTIVQRVVTEWKPARRVPVNSVWSYGLAMSKKQQVAA